MTDSKAAARAHGGRPFTKGDPRINTSGRKSKAAVQLAAEMSKALSDEGLKDARFKKLAEMCWVKALRGDPFFVSLIWERIVGKVVQPIGGGDDGSSAIRIEVVHIGKGGGNGNGNGGGNGHSGECAK